MKGGIFQFVLGAVQGGGGVDLIGDVAAADDDELPLIAGAAAIVERDQRMGLLVPEAGAIGAHMFAHPEAVKEAAVGAVAEIGEFFGRRALIGGQDEFGGVAAADFGAVIADHPFQRPVHPAHAAAHVEHGDPVAQMFEHQFRERAIRRFAAGQLQPGPGLVFVLRHVAPVLSVTHQTGPWQAAVNIRWPNPFQDIKQSAGVEEILCGDRHSPAPVPTGPDHRVTRWLVRSTA